MRALAQDASAGTSERQYAPGPLSGQNGGRGLMRRMMIAAAIACGLIALGVLLLPLGA
jgi:hypothetical protein